MTIIEFLLARIAEDEAATYTLEPYDCEPGCCAPAGWVGSRCHYCDAVASYGGTAEAITAIAEEHAETVHQRSRVLAECQAKRAIVEDVASGHFDRDYDEAVKYLAAVYADHPDYRQEWRPT